jgi:hypothetical protein
MKRTIALLAALVLSCVALAQGQIGVLQLATNVTATGAQAPFPGISGGKTYQMTGATTAGAGSAVAAVQCSGDGSNWDTLGTITLVLATTSSSDSFASLDRCRWVRLNVTTLTGTGAAVAATMGY